MPPSREPVNPAVERFAVPPDPGQAGTLDDLVEQLRLLKVWAGDPSYERITDRINRAWRAAGRPAGELATKTTVVRCFRPGRRRLNTDLVLAIVGVLHPDVGYVAQWHQALRVVGGEVEAAAQVRVEDRLPPDLAEFTGRTGELDRLLHHARCAGGAAVTSAIEGMAGVGKTQLAVRAAHLLLGEPGFERVLFVNLRGFHPDPAQPPADPDAVLDGFLRVLGVPGQQIPHDVQARAAAYRECLAGTRTLVVLDNAADAAQVGPLVAGVAGCLTLVTSRRSLSGLRPATRVVVDVFSPQEAAAFLTRAVPGIAVGADSGAAGRIAARCGYLPLALSLVAGHIRATPGWTLTDHAERLDERRHQLDVGVQVALDLSYRHLPADGQRLLRLAALHPGQDFDASAVAALTGDEVSAVRERLRHLCRDHLLQRGSPGRYGFHDLVRAYAADRAIDTDTPAQRRLAVTRLFDFYLAAAAGAMDVVAASDGWLDTELANLLAAAAAHGWPEHTWQLSAVLDRHLLARGRHHDARTLHQHALDLARHHGNRPAEMNAHNRIGYVHRRLGDYEQAAGHYQAALRIAESIGDRHGELTALNGLAFVLRMLGRHEQAGEHYEAALRIAHAAGDHGGELNALTGLGHLHWILGRYKHAGDHYERAIQIAQNLGDRNGELHALIGHARVQRTLGHYEQAGDQFERALHSAQAIGDRVGELTALHGLGQVHRMLGRQASAGGYHERALQIARETGNRSGELQALNGLGHVHRTVGRHDAAAQCYQRLFGLARELRSANWQYEALQGLGRLHHATGRPELALTHHEQALQHATDLGQAPDQARAHDGLAHAYYALNDHGRARQHWQHALDILISIGTDHTEEVEAGVPNIRACLANLE